MPCSDSNIVPQEYQKSAVVTCQMIVYCFDRENRGKMPEYLSAEGHSKKIHRNRVRQIARDQGYTSLDILKQEADLVTAYLCDWLREMHSQARERLVYNAHDRQARRLADWWEDHQEADKSKS